MTIPSDLLATTTGQPARREIGRLEGINRKHLIPTGSRYEAGRA